MFHVFKRIFMVKRNIVLLFAIAAIVGSVSAQIRPGIKMGYNVGGVMATNNVAEANIFRAGISDNFRMKSGFQGGIIADWPINDVYAIQPGVRFIMHGFIDKYRDAPSGDARNNTRRFALYYLQVPVYAQYRWNVAEETNVLFQAGPYFGYGLFGRHSWMRSGKDQKPSDKDKKISFGNGTSKDIRNGFDYGIGAGVGIEFYRFQFMVAYDFGLYEMTYKKSMKSASYNVGMRNHNLSVTLAVIFGRRDPLHGRD